MSEQFPCLGLSILGLCSYNPAQPTPVYFTLGNAIAALALTLAVQQLLKPIYIFRLRAHRLKIIYFVFLVFLGFACAVVAMLLPNLPISHGSFFQYPIVWELAGGLLIGLAYTAAAFVLLTPARIYAFNLVPFIRAGSTLLAEADDVDRASFAEDLLGRPYNIARLISYASAWQRAETHGTWVEMERLREIGAPTVIQGRPPISAFYLFAHRTELEAARHAGTFLRIISDPQFCSVLVRKCPWLTAGIVSEISKKEMYAEQAKSFVQEIARQAIINDESIMAKEVSYDGFGIMPLLSITLFTDWFILFYYNPLGKMSFISGPEPSGAYVSRLNGASKMMLETAIRNRDYWEHSYMYGVESAYESLFQKLSYRRYKGTPSDFLVNLHIGVMDLYKSLSEGLESLEPEQRQPVFIASIGEHRHDLIHTIASIIYESLASIANRFLGVDDEGWIHAIRTFSDIYPSIGKAPAGMNPLQQQLAVQLIEKLRHNMEGMYPAISRLLLAVIGPYRDPPEISARTAFVIIKDAVYKELQKLPILHAKEPERIADYLPSNVTYNAASNTLTHTYLRGEPRVTRLSELNIPKVELTDHCNWQI